MHTLHYTNIHGINTYDKTYPTYNLNALNMMCKDNIMYGVVEGTIRSYNVNASVSVNLVNLIQ